MSALDFARDTLAPRYFGPAYVAAYVAAVRELRTIDTPNLTPRERNQAVRANARSIARAIQEA